MMFTDNNRTMAADRKVLVRVCCNATCTKPMRVFGCTREPGAALYCEDCRSRSPAVYLGCAIRGAVPFAGQVTHGFCRQCAQEVLAAAKMHREAKARKPAGMSGNPLF